MFDKLNVDAAIVEQGDVLGGKQTLDSNVYAMVVEMAYINVSKSGALGLVLGFTGMNKESHNETVWMTSGTAKGGNNYYMDKSGNKQYLPGFTAANKLFKTILGKNIGECTPEDKMVGVFNYELKKDVPTSVKVYTQLIGKPVSLGIVRKTTDVTALDEATGKYLPTGDTRDINEISAVFRTVDGLTNTEIAAEIVEAVFLPKWLEKNKGITRNVAKGKPKSAKGNPLQGAPKTGSDTSEEVAPLF